MYSPSTSSLSTLETTFSFSHIRAHCSDNKNTFKSYRQPISVIRQVSNDHTQEGPTAVFSNVCNFVSQLCRLQFTSERAVGEIFGAVWPGFFCTTSTASLQSFKKTYVCTIWMRKGQFMKLMKVLCTAHWQAGAELEPGHGSPGHRVTGSVILFGSGRVSGQTYLLIDPVL